jgi:Zn-finger nucleic acid-binding protein
MKCPHCDLDLVMADRSGIEIDFCPKCRGVWLDRGELDKIIERSLETAPPVATAASGPWDRAGRSGLRDEHGGREAYGHDGHHGGHDGHGQHPGGRKSFWREIFD